MLILIGILAACEPAVPAKPAPAPAPTPTPATEASCADSAIRLPDREDASVHGAIVDDTLHMGGRTAQATCTEAANLSLLAAFSIPDDRTAQVQQSQYYLIRIQYPDRTLLYIIRRSVVTACVVDTNDTCVATVSGLPDDFDVSDLPGDVPPRIPAGRDAPEPPVTTDTAPDAVENPYPTNQATGVTVDAPLLSWVGSPQATSYDLYWGTTKDLAADADLGTPINTSDTAASIRRPGDRGGAAAGGQHDLLLAGGRKERRRRHPRQRVVVHHRGGAAERRRHLRGQLHLYVDAEAGG